MKRCKYVISLCISDERFEKFADKDLNELSEEFEQRLHAFCTAYPEHVEFRALGQQDRDALNEAQVLRDHDYS